MIIFDKDLVKTEPNKMFINFYDEALSLNQINIEAVCLSTVSKELQPRSRFVNVKYINNDGIVFFTNYHGPKGNDIDFNNKVSLAFYWNVSDSQIRIEGHAKKLTSKVSDEHWSIRSPEKKALAVSSHQSKVIKTYEEVQKNFENALTKSDLSTRPDYWGGYVINPYKYEFWKGNNHRINKRICFELKENLRNKYIIQP